MTTNQPLSLFISSKMQELADERRAVQTALDAYRMSGWIWEEDAGARPEPIRSTKQGEKGPLRSSNLLTHLRVTINRYYTSHNTPIKPT